MSNFLPASFSNLLVELQQLPGLGPKSALRIATYILTQPQEVIKNLADAIITAKEKIVECKNCGNITETPLCPICSDKSRDRTLLCVVEAPTDIIVFERLNIFQGTYLVLGGSISYIDRINPDNLRINLLIERLKDGETKEVIIATSTDTKGEVTAMYITNLLKQFPAVKVTRLAYGLPFGSSIEYADSITLRKALEGRIELK